MGRRATQTCICELSVLESLSKATHNARDGVAIRSGLWTVLYSTVLERSGETSSSLLFESSYHRRIENCKIWTVHGILHKIIINIWNKEKYLAHLGSSWAKCWRENAVKRPCPLLVLTCLFPENSRRMWKKFCTGDGGVSKKRPMEEILSLQLIFPAALGPEV
jgi:hypothetical protein